MHKYKFEYVSNTILREWGKKLYKNTYSMITELLANGYDANAKKELVWFKKTGGELNEIYIFDSGFGMSVEDIQNKFLQIGYAKRKAENIAFNGRPPMGRKGLGKLAIFGLGNIIDIISKKEGSDQASIHLSKIDIESNNEPTSIENIDREFQLNFEKMISWGDSKTGTIIKISDFLSKKAISDLTKNIDNRIYNAFRPLFNETMEENLKVDFYTLNSSDFDISSLKAVNNNDQNYLNYLQVFDFNFFQKKAREKILNNNLVNKDIALQKILNSNELIEKRIINGSNFVSNKDFKDEFKKDLYENYDEENLDEKLFKKILNMYGYIGILDTIDGKKGKGSGLNSSLPIYASNRIMLPNYINPQKNKQVGINYIVGEFFADFLDENYDIDLATPGRDGMDEDSNEYIYISIFFNILIKKLINLKNKILKKIGLQNERQKKVYVTNIQNIINKINQKIENKIDNKYEITKEDSDILTSNWTYISKEKPKSNKNVFFISYKNFNSKNFDFKKIEERNAVSDFVSDFVSKVIFTIVNTINKDYNLFKIVYLKKDPNINDGTDIPKYIKENCLSTKIQNIVALVCVSWNYINNWFTDIEYGAIDALNNNSNNGLLNIFDIKETYDFLSDYKPLSDTPNPIYIGECIDFEKKYFIKDKIFEFIDKIFSIIKTKFDYDCNDYIKDKIWLNLEEFFNENKEQVLIFIDSINLLKEKIREYNKKNASELDKIKKTLKI